MYTCSRARSAVPSHVSRVPFEYITSFRESRCKLVLWHEDNKRSWLPRKDSSLRLFHDQEVQPTRAEHPEPQHLFGHRCQTLSPWDQTPAKIYFVKTVFWPPCYPMIPGRYIRCRGTPARLPPMMSNIFQPRLHRSDSISQDPIGCGFTFERCSTEHLPRSSHRTFEFHTSILLPWLKLCIAIARVRHTNHE